MLSKLSLYLIVFWTPTHLTILTIAQLALSPSSCKVLGPEQSTCMQTVQDSLLPYAGLFKLEISSSGIFPNHCFLIIPYIILFLYYSDVCGVPTQTELRSLSSEWKQKVPRELLKIFEALFKCHVEVFIKFLI